MDGWDDLRAEKQLRGSLGGHQPALYPFSGWSGPPAHGHLPTAGQRHSQSLPKPPWGWPSHSRPVLHQHSQASPWSCGDGAALARPRCARQWRQGWRGCGHSAAVVDAEALGDLLAAQWAGAQRLAARLAAADMATIQEDHLSLRGERGQKGVVRARSHPLG